MIIDNEFRSLIPPLTDEEYEGLKASILAEGCRDALVLWGDTLIDGHNRYQICTEYGIPFKTVQHDFADRDEAAVGRARAGWFRLLCRVYEECCPRDTPRQLAAWVECHPGFQSSKRKGDE